MMAAGGTQTMRLPPNSTLTTTRALNAALALCLFVLGASTAGLAQVADPEAPDQSELLKNSKDRDFILRNFRTMYVDAQGAKYFGSDQMKAALGKNKDFWKLNIRIVDDRRVADAVLKVDYTFAWDYPFELTHQNTTIVLLSGKGEGPFSGPLGAADVARQFVNMAKPWREEKKKTENK
jgi:disulfide oxidoreductase YuzD